MESGWGFGHLAQGWLLWKQEWNSNLPSCPFFYASKLFIWQALCWSVPGDDRIHPGDAQSRAFSGDLVKPARYSGFVTVHSPLPLWHINDRIYYVWLWKRRGGVNGYTETVYFWIVRINKYFRLHPLVLTIKRNRHHLPIPAFRLLWP